MATKFNGTPRERLCLDALIKLTRAADAITDRTSKSYAAAELTGSQFGVLEALLHLGPLNQGELGKKILRSSGNMTLVVDHLEKRGLVRRERGTADRRQVTIHLTDKGRTFISNIFPEHVVGVVREMSVLNKQELTQLAELCRKLGTANSAPAKKEGSAES